MDKTIKNDNTKHFFGYVEQLEGIFVQRLHMMFCGIELRPSSLIGKGFTI
jgi:hypothetical protein